MSGQLELLIDPEDVEVIEFSVDAFARQVISGEHKSIFTSTSGFDLVGVRDKQPDDPVNRVNWPRSTLTGFNPLQVLEFTAERSVDVIICADASLSTRCGAYGVTVAHSIARALAVFGVSANLFNDRVGLVLFGAEEEEIEMPRYGRENIWYLLEEYSFASPSRLNKRPKLSNALTLLSQQTSLIVVISDCTFPEVAEEIKELSSCIGNNDAMLVVVDNSFAFDIPIRSAGWVDGEDIESGERLVLSLPRFSEIKKELSEFQQFIVNTAEAAGIAAVVLKGSFEQQLSALIEFFFEKRFKNRQ